jgi:hypothetical protein
VSYVLAALIGIASFYHWHPGEAAAGPALRHGHWRGDVVAVCRTPMHWPAWRCVVVRLTDFCGCLKGEPDERAIDLDRRSFAMLAPPRLGLVTVVVLP